VHWKSLSIQCSRKSCELAFAASRLETIDHQENWERRVVRRNCAVLIVLQFGPVNPVDSHRLEIH